MIAGDCRPSLTVLQSSRMASSRLCRAGTLLLVLWLTADLAAFGFCSGDSISVATQSASMSALDGSDATPSCCAGHHCFCCASSVEVIRFELPRHAEGTVLAPSPGPQAADISIRTTSPPPKF